MLKEFAADLHIHTCLSPCADSEMIPPNILNMAKLLGTKIIGISDHNSAKNLQAMIEASRNYEILVLPGIEVQSKEEVHVLCLFERLKEALEFQDFIYSHLPQKKNYPQYFGHQYVVDAQGNVKGEEERLLIASTDLSVDEILKNAYKLGGIVIPAHIDRNTFGILGQLGFIPEYLRVDAVEFSKNISLKEARGKFPFIFDRFPVIFSSDAHCLKDMVFQKTYFLLKEPTFEEIKKALIGIGGRGVVLRE
ncbi:MAG: PHP domain-containing protein [Thermosediminibacteraceae bacterium]|nr:PHP domain-containing protein [Thermosediminibacteraceae bacterium]